MIKTKDTEIWGYVKSHFPTFHLFKNIYLVRKHKYTRQRISTWFLVIVESEVNNGECK